MTDTTSMRTFTADNPATRDEIRECIRLVAEAAPDGVNPVRVDGGCAYVRSDDIVDQDDNVQPHCIAGEVLSRFFGISDADLSRCEGHSVGDMATDAFPHLAALRRPLDDGALGLLGMAQIHADDMLAWGEVAEAIGL